MATITATQMGNGSTNVAKVVLDDDGDTFDFTPNARQILVLENETGSPVTVTIVGDDVTAVAVPGVGDVDISAGYSTGAIADGESVAISLDTIREYLKGAIDISGADGVTASLLSFR